MIKIMVMPHTPEYEGGEAWLRIIGPASKEVVFNSESYSTLSNARRAAKTWNKRIPNSIIIDKTKK